MFQVVQRVVFLHEELMKLPFFPRKALESDLDLYQGGELGKVSITTASAYKASVHEISCFLGAIGLGCAAQVHVGAFDCSHV